MAAGEGDPRAWFRPVLAPRPRGWDEWAGVAGMLYAWWRPSSPALVLRARGLAALRRKMRAEERRRGMACYPANRTGR